MHETLTGKRHSSPLNNRLTALLFTPFIYDREGSVSIGGWLITNFHFADDIVVNTEEEEASW